MTHGLIVCRQKRCRLYPPLFQLLPVFMTSGLEAAVLRTLAWFMTMSYPPLRQEVIQDIDLGEVWLETTPTKAQIDWVISLLVAARKVICQHDRLVLPGYETLFEEQSRRERVFPRKWRRIQNLARWLRFLPSVRFLAVCNTTALGSARDLADIDLFVVVREGTVWMTRGFLALCAAFTFRRPGERRGEQDAWCFSFFMDDSNVDLQRFALPDGDPYLRFWTRRLLPVLDDGVGTKLWEEQSFAWKRQPFASRWLSWRSMTTRANAVPSWIKQLDLLAMRLQKLFGSKMLWQAAATDGTEVVLDAHTFKTHLQDRRRDFRMTYESLCTKLDIVS